MASIRDPLEDLESQRLRLEENVAKLQASLRHWQAWEIEYEGMKEEISELGENPMPADLETLSRHNGTAFGVNAKTTLTQEERKAILWTEKGVLRKPDEIRSLLTRRTDYVEQNIKMVTSLIRASKEKLAASTILSQPEVLNEDGLPLTEIHEELDEGGNVISSFVSEPGKTATKAVEAIENAAGDLVFKENGTKSAALSPYGASNAPSGDLSPETSKLTVDPTTKNPTSPKKRLSTPVEADYASVSSDHKAREQKLLNEISDREADELERKDMANSVVPEIESAEDAVLRRQMIQYNMDEVGSVVAEIDLEDDATSSSDHESELDLEDDDEEEEEEVDDDDDEDEDEFGRTSKSKPLDEAYVKRMQKLSDRLKADAMINIGSGRPTEPKERRGSPTTNATGTGPKGVSSKKKGVQFAQDLDIQESPKSGNTSRQANGAELQSSSVLRKGVRFANDLDIQEAPEVSVADLLSTSSAMTGIRVGESIRQVHGSVVERGGAATEDALVNEAENRTGPASKFKTARAQVSTNASIAKAYDPTRKAPHAAKPSVILADTLVERPFKAPATASVAPPDIDEFNPGLLDREVSSEYHKLRSRQIQREGGFLRNSDDQAEVPLTEEEGGPKRMSKFKAARLGLL